MLSTSISSGKKKGDDDDDNGDKEQPYTKGKKRKSSKSKASMIADDHDIIIKSNINSTKESDDSYVKVADDSEIFTNNKAVSTPKATMA